MACAGQVLDARADRGVLSGLVVLVVVVHLIAHRGGLAVGMDMATQFIPWFGWLGEQLSAGTVPQWNPAVFSGTPSAGDPLSGWGYLLAMLPFSVLPLGAAVHVFVVSQLVLVATGTYVLARALRLPPAAALAAALVATFNGFVFQRNVCCVAFASVEAWLPWLLLGIDRSLATTGARRVGAWALAGLALSQIAAGWPGQGTLYVLLLAAAWLVGRGLAGPLPPRRRLRVVATNAVALGAVGTGLSAAGVWPRLQINPATNLAGGYPGQSLTNWYAGWWPADWVELLRPGIWHVGAVSIALAVVAVVVARRERPVQLLAAVVIGALVLALPIVTPLNAPLFAIPGMDRVLTHAPQRALLVAYPAIALLVGVAVARLRIPRVAAPVVALLLIALLAGELAWSNVRAFQHALDAPRNPALMRRIDPDAFYEPSGAGRFLQRERDRGELGRYAAFTPVPRPDGSVVAASYFFFWHYPSVQWLEAHNESMLLGLEHIQGYNPIHLARYDDLIAAGNRRDQDYHVANLVPTAFDSSVFDLLNGRWVVLNRGVDHTDPDLVGERMASWPQVYLDEQVRVLRNPDALPRAWLVHEARQVAPGEAPALLAGGDVDPRTTALLEVAPPPLDPDGRGTVRVIARDTDALTIDVEASGDALLVVSETFHPAWRATVDGRPADLRVTDHVLRGVAVPAGRHTVEISHDRTVLSAGLAVTAVTALALAAAAWWARRRPAPGVSASSSVSGRRLA
ncbi:hypothetical protein BH23ACT10_BH23ACT10_16650 [soil metagenome]